MDITIINECGDLSREGKITFPEVIAKLTEGGVERYLVDLVGLENIYYGINGSVYSYHFEAEDLKVPQKFNASAVKSAIGLIQKNKIDYIHFLRLIVAAGCCHYEVYIAGRQVIYLGRDGSHHIEKFP